MRRNDRDCGMGLNGPGFQPSGNMRHIPGALPSLLPTNIELVRAVKNDPRRCIENGLLGTGCGQEGACSICVRQPGWKANLGEWILVIPD
jgi:hypothetical protein